MILHCRTANGANLTVVFSASLRQQADREAEVLNRPGRALTRAQHRRAMSHRLDDDVVRRKCRARHRQVYKQRTRGRAREQ